MKSDLNFLLNFFSLNTVSIVIKVLNFLFFLFLVRTLSLEEYGVYILVWSQVNFFTPLLDFGTTSYGLVYMNDEKKKELNSLLTLRLIIGFVIFVVTVLSSLLYIHQSSVPLYILLTSFAVFGNVAYGGYVIVMSLKRKAYISSLYSLVFTILLVLASSTVLFLSRSLLNVFITVFILYNLNAAISWILIKKAHSQFSFIIDRTFWKDIISKSFIFVLISFFLGIYFKIDIFLLKFLKSDIDVGVYSAGYKFFESLLFIIGSYNFAATPQLAKLYKENVTSFIQKIKKDVFLLFMLGMVIAGITYFIAPFLLSLVLKESSVASATVLRIVIFALPFMLISTVLSTGLYILNKAHIIIIVYILQIIVNVLLNIIFIPKYSYIASSYISLVNEILNVLIFVALFKYFESHENKH